MTFDDQIYYTYSIDLVDKLKPKFARLRRIWLQLIVELGGERDGANGVRYKCVDVIVFGILYTPILNGSWIKLASLSERGGARIRRKSFVRK